MVAIHNVSVFILFNHKEHTYFFSYGFVHRSPRSSLFSFRFFIPLLFFFSSPPLCCMLLFSAASEQFVYIVFISDPSIALIVIAHGWSMWLTELDVARTLVALQWFLKIGTANIQLPAAWARLQLNRDNKIKTNDKWISVRWQQYLVSYMFECIHCPSIAWWCGWHLLSSQYLPSYFLLFAYFKCLLILCDTLPVPKVNTRIFIDVASYIINALCVYFKSVSHTHRFQSDFSLSIVMVHHLFVIFAWLFLHRNMNMKLPLSECFCRCIFLLFFFSHFKTKNIDFMLFLLFTEKVYKYSSAYCSKQMT